MDISFKRLLLNSSMPDHHSLDRCYGWVRRRVELPSAVLDHEHGEGWGVLIQDQAGTRQEGIRDRMRQAVHGCRFYKQGWEILAANSLYPMISNYCTNILLIIYPTRSMTNIYGIITLSTLALVVQSISLTLDSGTNLVLNSSMRRGSVSLSIASNGAALNSSFYVAS